jgi:acetyl-CoA C-acetyltransferase
MKVAVIGAASTTFGERWDKSLADLLAESQLKALRDAGIKSSDVQAVFTGNMCAGSFAGQQLLGALAAEILRINCSSVTIEAACGSGGFALSAGIAAIQAGRAEIVLVNGVEKMTDVSVHQVTTGLMGAAHEQYEHVMGATFPGLNALIARAYMHECGLTREQLAAVSVKNHKHGALNPLAHFQKEITINDVIKSSMIADPLTVFDCAPVSDGASSVILCSEDFAKCYVQKNPDKKIVYIVGYGQAIDTLTLASRASLTEFKATQLAGQQAFAASGVGPKEIPVAEIHDAFTIAEIISLEDLGFFAKGQAGYATQQGKTTFGGACVINPSGGLKAKGHPVGASGVSQAYEIVMQLRGQAGKRQVQNARFGLTHSMGGCGTAVAVHIFSAGVV